ncbi:MAG TPA: hypothetical protein VGB37_12990 [Candidatus Lokiarchaeia archaeon]
MSKNQDKKSENSMDKTSSFDYNLDFTTSSAISRVNIKILVIYLPIFWLSGILAMIFWYEWTNNAEGIRLITMLVFLPYALFCMYFIFIFSSLFFCKIFLTLIILIHKPKEGIFIAEKGNKDFEFWCLRIELKKLAIWLLRNCPMPWIDVMAFKWFGVDMDYSSHLQDSWTDMEFIKFGRKVLVGQGAVVMSSMVVGKYLIVKKVIFDDYCVIGGQDVISPGTIVGKDTVVGALGMTNFNQVLEDGWIYFGFPSKKFKPNKYAESRRDLVREVDVDDAKAYEVEHDVNIDEDKKDLV